MSHSLPRRERERLARRAEILSAAQEVFAEKGYTDATLDEVATRAEFGKGTLYNYFPGGKQEILLAIVEQFHDELCDLVADTFDSQPEQPFRQALAAFLEHTFRFFQERAELFLTLLREAHRIGFSDDPGPRSFFLHQRSRALDALTVPIERAVQREELRPMPPRLLAHLILVNLNGAQMRACMAQSDPACVFPESSGEMASLMTSFLLDGAGPARAGA
ncbi:MAG: TetR/AcrR family transcriptional regulator [Bacteroidetes bacterium]|nr:TetR/AcrR family transcriptional regulator [Bacteroidota bacterium]